MTIVDSEVQRQRWIDKTTRVQNLITDLSREVSVAAGLKPHAYAALKLAEAYVALHEASRELDKAIARITVLS